MSQVGFGAPDLIGSPFDVVTAVASQAITARNGRLILNNGASVSGVAITLPSYPVDGATFELMSTGGTTASSIVAPTYPTVSGLSDAILGTAVTAFTANTTFKWAYSLNGDIAKGTNARSWFRIA